MDTQRAFHPLDLHPIHYYSALWVAMWQDRAKTIPAEVGDPVAVIESFTGPDLICSPGARRLTRGIGYGVGWPDEPQPDHVLTLAPGS